MAMSVHTNFGSLNAQMNLNRTNEALNTNLERLGTGKRVNSAKDDAAGLVIATQMSSDISAMEAGLNNIARTQDTLQTADQSMAELTEITDRMTELATNSANSVATSAERAAYDAEYQKLADEANRIVSDTTFAGGNLFDMLGAGSIQVVIGRGASGSSDVVSFDVSGEINTMTSSVGALGGVSLTTASGSMAALSTINTAVNDITAARSAVGANINSLEHTARNMENVKLNTEVAEGRIMDADFAKEGSEMSTNMLLMQSGTQAMTSANSMTGLALQMMG